ncbi:MAG: glycosyltransferase [Victivallales bacterium]|jgi:glycosyltransferase involved in cell wall biosynthesis|nr:glycosyltransferase [Victivallales bacterium]
MPLLSVIVPIYNTAERLTPCLDALLSQSIGDFELILINDGSTDNSEKICREYCARHPDKIRIFSGENRGVSFARNWGISQARGEWIAFCDSDDIPDSEQYSYLYNRAVATGADMSCCALRHFLPEGVEILTDLPCQGEEVLQDRDTIEQRFFLPLLLNRKTHNGYLMICLFHRDLIEQNKVRFIEELSMKEDEIFILEYLLGVKKIAVSDKVLYDYLYFPNSLVATHYFSRNDFFREKNWFLRAKAQRDLFLRSGMVKKHPELSSGFWLRMFYHAVQMICCDKSLTFGQRRKKLKLLASEARREDAGAPSDRAGKIFRYALLHCRVLLPWLCRVKRYKEARDRRAPVVRDNLLSYNESGGEKCRF